MYTYIKNILLRHKVQFGSIFHIALTTLKRLYSQFPTRDCDSETAFRVQVCEETLQFVCKQINC